MAHILVAGSLNMDLVVRVAAMPQPGETIFGRDFQMVPGGKGANQAIAAARSGAKVTLIGKVGADDFGTRLIENLVINGVNTKYIAVDKNAATGIATITLDERGQNSIIVASGANMRLAPKDIRAAWSSLKDVDMVVMPLEIPLDCVAEAAKLAKRAGAKVLLNPAPAQPLPAELLANLDLLIPNETELAILSGMPVNDRASAEKAAQVLFETGVETIIVTLGADGALLLQEGRAVYFAAPVVEVVDTTAAGDSFIGGLAAKAAAGKTLEEAIVYATCAGALAVTQFGAQPSIPMAADVEKLLLEGKQK